MGHLQWFECNEGCQGQHVILWTVSCAGSYDCLMVSPFILLCLPLESVNTKFRLQQFLVFKMQNFTYLVKLFQLSIEEFHEFGHQCHVASACYSVVQKFHARNKRANHI